MKLSLHTDYALRMLIYLAGRAERTQIAEVAEFYQISENHLAKVANLLSRAGLVRGTRGAGGGIELAVPSGQISVGQVVELCESSTHLLDCVGTPDLCVIQPQCKLRGVLIQAERLVLEYLRGVSLTDVVEPGGELREFLPLVELSSRKGRS